MTGYDEYFLTDNPFPKDPIIDPLNPDKRKNGSIFNSEIRQKELRELQAKMEDKLTMIYLRANSTVRGMGKSAVAVHEWRRLQQQPDVTSVYLDAKSGGPRDFCEGIVRAWHDAGYLWNALKDTLQAYAKKDPAPAIDAEIIDDILQRNPSMPATINLRRYMYKASVPIAIRKLIEWTLSTTQGVLPEVAESFFTTYLSKPPDFLHAHATLKRKVKGHDEIDCFRSLLQLLRASRYQHHYVFLDSFEYAIIGKGKGKELVKFCSDMRRVLEAGTGCLTVGATIHLDANTLLKIPECSPLTEIAPNDPRYVVEIERLNPDQSAKLALTYLDNFRGQYSAPDPLYPFDADALALIHSEAQGNTRRILRMLNLAISEGGKLGFPQISKDVIQQRNEEIVGKVRAEA